MPPLKEVFKAILDQNTDERQLPQKLTEAAEYASLKEQYKLLSELEEHFGVKSNHSGAIFVDKQMREILSRIKHLES